MKEMLDRIMKDGAQDYLMLTEEEKTVYNSQSILNAVNGKGLMQYYKDECGGYAEQALEQLYALGMDEIAAIIESANAIFPDCYPPEDTDERLEIIADFEDEYAALFDEWTEEILEFAPMLEAEIEILLGKIE